MKPRLLFIGPLPEPTTGQSLACKVLLDALHDTYDVTVVDLRKESFRQGANSLARIREVGAAIANVRRAQHAADIIYLTISESVAGNLKDLVFYAMCIGKLDRMVVHLHGGAGMRQLLSGSVVGLASANRYFLRKLGGVVVLGERLADMYRSFMPPERIAIAQNFAAEGLFKGDDQIKRNFGDLEKIRVLFLSNLLPGKGYIELLEAIDLLDSEESKRFHFDFAGGFEDDESKRDFLERVEGRTEIKYHGIVAGQKKEDLFDKAHIFCLPTYYPYEGQPISILEAYASGTVVVTTDHAGIFDTFKPGENGYVVDKRSAGSLVKVLRELLGDHADLSRIALNNAAAARRFYREEHYIGRMKKALARLVPIAGTASSGH